MTGLLARRLGYFARNDVIDEERGHNSWFTNKTKKSTSKPMWNNQRHMYYIISWKNILLFSLTSQSQSRFGSVQACSTFLGLVTQHATKFVVATAKATAKCHTWRHYCLIHGWISEVTPFKIWTPSIRQSRFSVLVLKLLWNGTVRGFVLLSSTCYWVVSILSVGLNSQILSTVSF